MSTKIYAPQTITSQDQRIQTEAPIGTLVAPGAAVGGTAAITAAQGANVTQSISGYQPAEVQKLLDSMFSETSAGRQAVEGLAESLSSGLSQQSKTLTEALAATRAPEQSALSSILPLVALAVVLFVVWGR
jgi:3-dehydroquinate synthetase